MSPVDAPYRLSVGSTTIDTGHRHKSAPVALQRQTRGLADRKDTDRLMATVDVRTDNAPPALCPLCGERGRGIAVPESDRITKANYICPDGHVWTSHWLEVNA